MEVKLVKVLQINGWYPDGSTGKIVKNISELLEDNGDSSYIAFGSSNSKEIKLDNQLRIKTKMGVYISIIQTRLWGRNGFNDKMATHRLIHWINIIQPDIIHLHNIHGHYVNVKLLFGFLKEIDIPVIWTLHDCWSITGHCAYFDYVGCNKWKKGCHNCQQLKYYPISFSDRSKINYSDKKRIFTSLLPNRLEIVVPSKWLKNIIKQSFLNKYSVRQIYNGIDLDIFRPVQSHIRTQFGLNNKKIILAVVYGYNERKGLLDLNILAELLEDSYKILVIGIAQKDREKFNSKILVLGKTDTQYELAEFYSAADVYVNLTLEEVLGMTNIEALACGTPVITYDSGGSTECVDQNTGVVVEKGNIEQVKQKIVEVLAKPKSFYFSACRLRAEQYFDKKVMAEQYLQLYKEKLLCNKS